MDTYLLSQLKEVADILGGSQGAHEPSFDTEFSTYGFLSKCNLV